MYREWTHVLQRSLLFRGIGEDSLAVMLECLKPRIRRCRQREIIVTRGQPFEGLGIIAGGRVALTRDMYSGNRIILGLLDEGDIFGEMVAFSDSKVWPMTVIAHEDSVLLFLPPGKITGTCSNICASHSALIMNMLTILSNRVLMLDRKIEHISAGSIRGKVSSYLLDMYRQAGKADFTIPLKRHELADYLGIPRPSLSREMIDMQRDGIIAFKGSDIEVKNVLELERGMH